MNNIDSIPSYRIPRAFGGPTYSHYEFYEPGISRLTDEEWRHRLYQNQEPAPPEWTAGWLIRSP